MGKLFAASLYVIVAICAMIFGVSMLLLIKADLSMPVTLSLAGGIAAAVVILQFSLGPMVIDWIVKTRWTTPAEIGPDFDKWMRETCSTFKIPVPRFGIIEEAAPNAFTYGHGAYDARVVVTRGLIDVLSPEELKSVVAHELGHIRHRDFIVMTMVQALVLVLYALYIASRSNRRGSGAWVVIASYIAYWLSYYASLLLSRIREYMADYASAQIMQNGNDLSRALVKISYGLARTQAVINGYVPAPAKQAGAQIAPTASYATAGATNPYEEQWNSPQKDAPLPTGPDMATLITQRWNAEAQAKKDQAKAARPKPAKEAFSASNLGAFGIAGSGSMRSAIAWFGETDQPDPSHFIVAARWELFNPWAKIAEIFSTHPLTALRIKALQKLNSIWNVPNEFDFAQIKPAKYKFFLRDLFIVMLPMIGAAAGAGTTLAMGDRHSEMAIVRPFIAAGIGYFVLSALKVLMIYPGEFKPNQVLRLLGEVNVSHMKPIPVALEGVFTSRVSPGIAWAKDFILQDDTGFVACVYRQPLSMWEFLWGWIGAERYVGRRVRVYGWYRRFGAPYVEISRFETTDFRERVRTYFMPYVLVGSLVMAGLLTWLLIALK